MKPFQTFAQQMILAAALTGSAVAQAPQSFIASPSDSYGELPLVFEPNFGQTDPQVRYLARTQGMVVFFTDSEAVMVLQRRAGRGQEAQAVIRMRLMGAMAPRETRGLDKLPGLSNYFIGNDPKAWRSDIPQYSRVRHSGVYPGVDLVYYGNHRKLEYDFVVAPDSNPNQVQIAWDGVDAVNLNDAGDLILRTPLGDVVQRRPRVYQDTSNGRVEIAANYVLAPRNRVTFALARYDRTRPLVIDPVIVFSNYLGGASDEDSRGIAVDSCGFAFVTGTTPSAKFPGIVLAPNNSNKTQPASQDVFVTKFSMNGTSTLYSTFFGGGGNDHGLAIAVDSSGAAYITGDTNSNSTFVANQFPTQSAMQPNFGGGFWDAFVVKLSPGGNALVYSTLLGGTGDDTANGIAVDSSGAVYVTGSTTSPNFPLLNAFQASNGSNPPGFDAFVTKLSATGSLVYSTYLGGEAKDIGYGIAVDSSFSAYVTGVSYSTMFPVTSSSYQPTASSSGDAFVTKLSPSGNSLVYSTYLGGTDEDIAYAIAVDGSGAAYVTGTTKSLKFPTTQGAYKTALTANGDVFVTKLSSTGSSLIFSTYLDGSGTEIGYGIAVDSSGNSYIAGSATSDILGLSSPPAGDNGFVAKLPPAGNSVVYGMYLGGSANDYAYAIAVDPSGAAYVTGTTLSTDFTGVMRSTTDTDAFVTKVNDTPIQPPAAAQITSPTPGGATGGSCVTFVWWNTASPSATSYRLDVGSTPGGTNFFSQNVGLAPSQNVCGLPTNGARVFARLTTNFPCVTEFNDFTFMGAMQFVPPGSVAVMQSPAPGSTLQFSIVGFSWSSGSQAASYKLDVGTWPGIGDLFSHNTGLSTSATVHGLPIPATIYVRLTTMLSGGGQVYYDYTYTTRSSGLGR